MSKKESGPRLTMQTLLVLRTMIERPTVSMAGVEIAEFTSLRSGTLYPILSRLEDSGWLSSEWENATPQRVGRPRRRFYELTAIGQKNAQAVFQQLEPNSGEFSWKR